MRRKRFLGCDLKIFSLFKQVFQSVAFRICAGGFSKTSHSQALLPVERVCPGEILESLNVYLKYSRKVGERAEF